MSEPPKVIDLEAERNARKRAVRSKLDEVLAKLRAMPVNERAETIVAMFAMVNREFARMVMDYSKPPKGSKRRQYARKVTKRADQIIRATLPRPKD